MIAEQGERLAAPGEFQDLPAVRTAIDEIPEQNQSVVATEREPRKQFSEFDMAPVNVADGYESPVHAAEKC
jgi:hypothetical protein